jgi:hypothetical protein
MLISPKNKKEIDEFVFNVPVNYIFTIPTVGQKMNYPYFLFLF